MREIDDFMAQLFPVEELRAYMWDHLASCLIGVNRDQTFQKHNKPDLDLRDPWQFKNFLVTDAG